MTFQTFTRPINARKAAEKALAAAIDSLAFEVFATGITAEAEREGGYSATVHIEGHTAAEAEAISETLQNKFAINNVNPKETNMSDTETQEPEAATETPTRRGRSPSLAGQKIFPTDACKDAEGNLVNPRRKATGFGYAAMQIVIENPGITVEDYRAKGGRLQDLKWDIAHGHVTTSF